MHDAGRIRAKVHVPVARAVVWEALATDAGRARFWAESARRVGDRLHFAFPNGWVEEAPVLEEEAGRRLVISYFGARTTWTLEDDARGGTVVTLGAEGVPEAERLEVAAGWVSVLLALKAALVHGVDLRNHDPARTWDEGFVDN